jgi:hypothetical protein
VKYYAAYLAKFREQAIAEAEMFKKMYTAQTKTEAVAFQMRIIPDPYAK